MFKTIVMMACFNGSRYLAEQLDSVRAQEGELGTCILNDDGSTDETVNLVQDYCNKNKNFTLLDLPVSRSATKAFLSLLAHTYQAGQEHIGGEKAERLFAFSDQDDIWLTSKLRVAREAVMQAQAHAGCVQGTTPIPVLYGGRTLAVTAQNKEIGLSPLFKKPPSFRNALVQSIMGGNTMVFNEPAAKVVASAGVCDVPAHDWLTYLLVSGVGGVVIYDPTPQLRYRQHEKNVVGSNLGWKARWSRLQRVWRGDLARWNSAHIKILNQLFGDLTVENQQVFRWYERACSAAMPWTRIYALYKSGVYRQTLPQTTVLYLMCLFRRL
jgi:glycosyltransferase involved in cell wall biosynthesis